MLVRFLRIVWPPVRLTFRVVRWVFLPLALLLALSVASGLVRTSALCAFGVVALLRGAIVSVDFLAERVPAPRLSWEVAR